MTDWHEVTTLAELQAFLLAVGNFHDGIIKEVHWINRDYVADTLSMSPYQLSDARVVVQRQWRDPPAVEMVFERVWSFGLDTVIFVFGSAAGTELSSTELGPAQPVLVLEMEATRIAFERMRWRDASDWMGPTARFGDFAVGLPGRAD